MSGERRRQLGRASGDGDVLRWRGLVPALVATALAVIVALAWRSGWSGLMAPGPLSLPHQRAALACASCHARPDPSQSCTGCHGAHVSERAGHRAALHDGRLKCASCHRVHHDEQGVTIASDGTVTRWGPGFATVVGVSPARDPGGPVDVPLVPASTCAGCHALDDARDAAHACVTGGRATCFDEHRAAATLAPEARVRASPARDAAWEVARAAATLPAPRAARLGAASALPLSAVLLSGLTVWLVARRGVRPARRAAPPRTSAADGARRLPVIDTNTCLGCYACVDVCPYDVLEIQRYVAVVARPDACCGLLTCEQRCPNGSLVVSHEVEVADRPLVTAALEAEGRPGLYLAGDLTGLPLIRNALAQGAAVAREIARDLASGPRAPGAGLRDLVIVGAGPAGLAAAIVARRAGLDVCVLEQGDVLESIRGFPRQKLVVDQGSDDELPLWLESCEKEALLSRWLLAVRRENLEVHPRRRVVAIDRVRGGPPLGNYRVSSRDVEGREEVIEARRVLVATGRRGSPRRLDLEIPDAAAPFVHSALADARSFAGRRVLVVGLGDVALEAALALAGQPGTHVTVSYRGGAFRRGQARTLAAFEREVAAGRIALEWHSEVTRVSPSGDAPLLVERRVRSGSSPGTVELRRDALDALFVLIGALPGRDLLDRAGVSWPRGSAPERPKDLLE